MKSTLAACGLALLLAACATPDGAADHDRGDGQPPHKPPPAPSLFISPAGQPFRAGPGEPYPVARWFAQANTAHDGKLTRAEFRADTEAFFHILDVNHDGIVDGFEANDYEQSVVPEIMGAYSGRPDHRQGEADGAVAAPAVPAGRAGAPSAGANAVLQGAAVYGLLNEPEPVTATDLNLDGRITLVEFLKSADRRFDKLDAKQLGYLTLDDLPKTPAQLMATGKYKQGRNDERQRQAQQPF